MITYKMNSTSGLSSQVPYYEYALDFILDVESSHGKLSFAYFSLWVQI